MGNFKEDMIKLTEYIGGKDNIVKVSHCISRLRIVLKDDTIPDTKAIENLELKPDVLLIDAVKLDIDIKQCSITKGDFKSYSIGCASIVAKVFRDRMMNELPEEYQKYKIAKNKGYGTKEHIKAIDMYGASDMHRYSFEPIKSLNNNIKEDETDSLPL